MSPYVEAGYTVVLVTLAAYTLSLVRRERAARRRAKSRRERPDSSR